MKEQKRDLAKDLELCEKATLGPWYATCGRDGMPDIAVFLPYTHRAMEDRFSKDVMNANLRLVEEFREGWPEAIRRAMEAEAERDELREKQKLAKEALLQMCDNCSCKDDDPNGDCEECITGKALAVIRGEEK